MDSRGPAKFYGQARYLPTENVTCNSMTVMQQ